MEIVMSLFKIGEEDKKQSLYLFILFFISFFYLSSLFVISEILLITETGITLLSNLYIISGIIIVIMLFAFVKRIYIDSKEKSTGKIFWFLGIIHYVGTAVLIINRGYIVSYFGFYILSVILFYGVFLLMWLRLQEIIRAADFKGIFGMMAAGGAVGGVSAGYIIMQIKNYDSLFGYYTATGILVFFISILSGRIGKLFRRGLPETKTGAKIKVFESLRYIIENRFYLVLTLSGIAMISLYYLNDYVVAEHIAHPAVIANFTGIYGRSMVLGFSVMAVFSFYFSGRYTAVNGILSLIGVILLAANFVSLTNFTNIIEILTAGKGIYMGIVLFYGNMVVQYILFSIEKEYKDVTIFTILSLIISGSLILSGILEGIFKGSPTNSAIVLLLSAAGTIYWFARKHSFMKIVEKKLDFSGEMNISYIFGQKGIFAFMPGIMERFRTGNNMSREFIIDMVGSIPFRSNYNLYVEGMKAGAIETQMKIVDRAFHEGEAEFIVKVIKNIKPELHGYIIRKIFLNYHIFSAKNHIKEIENSGVFDCTKLGEYEKIMYDYLFSGDTGAFEKLSKKLLNSYELRDHEFLVEMLEIGEKYKERTRNSIYKIMVDGIEQRYEQFAGIAKLAWKYRDGEEFIREKFLGRYKYDEVVTMMKNTGNINIRKMLEDEKGAIKDIYLMCYETYRDGNRAWDRKREKNILRFLENITLELLKIEKIDSKGSEILINEIEKIRNSFLGIMVNYCLKKQKMPVIKEIYELLRDGEMREQIRQIFRELMPVRYGKSMEDIYFKRFGENSGGYNFGALTFRERQRELENIYRYIGGEEMDSNISESIERMIVLKSVPMFKELDIDMLYRVLKISRYKKYQADVIVMNEGEPGDSFFIILKGKVAVLKGEKFIANIETGGIIGELGVIDKIKRTATVKTVEETVFLVIDGDEFIRLLQGNGNISFAVIKTLTSRLRGMLEK